MSARGSSANALEHLRQVERCILAGAGDPEAVLEAVRASGRSVGATARLVGEFFEREGLCRALDDTDERARGRRARRLGRLGPSLRPAVGAFAEHLLGQRKRARLLGSNGLSDTTIEHRLADLAAFGALLGERGIDDWAAVSAGDVDAFLVANMNSRVASLRAFFAFAKQRKVVLVDPTAGVDHRSPKGFSGRVLLCSEQRKLLGRWAVPTSTPTKERRGCSASCTGPAPTSSATCSRKTSTWTSAGWSSGVGASLSLSTPSPLQPFEPASQLGSRWSPRTRT